ncbi:MAG: isochorismatase [Cyanobacteria bacterium P01_A01_bin.84]
MMSQINSQILSLPFHFQPQKVGEVWRVKYHKVATDAQTWSKEHKIAAASADEKQICLLLIDVQNTFCIPDFELFVGGKSGNGAVEDNIRLCEFIYRNLRNITTIIPTMDTHTAMQIFHPIFWVNQKGEHPIPSATNITSEDIEKGIWKVNPEVAYSITNGDRELLEKQTYSYVKKLSENGKYPLTVWSYHSMLGGIGHSLVSSIEEAIFFHSIARYSQTQFEIKGDNPLTENYSVLSPEVLSGFDNQLIAKKNTRLIKQLLEFDAVIIAGQAKSHCVAWTIEDLLSEIKQIDIKLAEKIYLLEDCTSPVVISNVVDYTEVANNTFTKFADAGMHLVKSTQQISDWIQL